MRYDRVAEEYEAAAVPWFTPLADDLVDRVCRGLVVRRFLDLGAGTGLVAGVARQRLGESVGIVALDPAVGMLTRIRSEVGAQRVAGAAPGLPFRDACFDAVAANLSLSHVVELQPALADITRLLRPSGRLAVSAWASPPGPEDGDQRRDVDVLIDEVAAGCHIDSAPPRPAAPWEEELQDPAFLRHRFEAAGLTGVQVEHVKYRQELPLEVRLTGWEGRSRYRRAVAGEDRWAAFLQAARARAREQFGKTMLAADRFLIATGTARSAP